MDIHPHRSAHILAGGDDENPILSYVLRPRSVDELVQMVSAKPNGSTIDLPSGLLDILHKEANYPDCFGSLDAVARLCMDVLVATNEHKAGFAARLAFDIAASAQSLAIQAYRHGKHEQSASFILNRRRRRWIDSLAASNQGAIGSTN
jgi:hypothetical protein